MFLITVKPAIAQLVERLTVDQLVTCSIQVVRNFYIIILIIYACVKKKRDDEKKKNIII